MTDYNTHLPDLLWRGREHQPESQSAFLQTQPKASISPAHPNAIHALLLLKAGLHQGRAQGSSGHNLPFLLICLFPCSNKGLARGGVCIAQGQLKGTVPSSPVELVVVGRSDGSEVVSCHLLLIGPLQTSAQVSMHGVDRKVTPSNIISISI